MIRRPTSSALVSFCLSCTLSIFTPHRLTGTPPFQGRNVKEVIAKNKECKISFAEQHWNNVTAEGKDLVARMLAKDPAERISAQEALAHTWFTLEHTSTSYLFTALENMKKHRNENRFNVELIKPEFSMITCCPLIGNKLATSRESSSLLMTLTKNRRLSANIPFSFQLTTHAGMEEIKEVTFSFCPAIGHSKIPCLGTQIPGAEKSLLAQKH